MPATKNSPLPHQGQRILAQILINAAPLAGDSLCSLAEAAAITDREYNILTALTATPERVHPVTRDLFERCAPVVWNWVHTAEGLLGTSFGYKALVDAVCAARIEPFSRLAEVIDGEYWGTPDQVALRHRVRRRLGRDRGLSVPTVTYTDSVPECLLTDETASRITAVSVTGATYPQQLARTLAELATDRLAHPEPEPLLPGTLIMTRSWVDSLYAPTGPFAGDEEMANLTVEQILDLPTTYDRRVGVLDDIAEGAEIAQSLFRHCRTFHRFGDTAVLRVTRRNHFALAFGMSEKGTQSARAEASRLESLHRHLMFPLEHQDSYLRFFRALLTY